MAAKFALDNEKKFLRDWLKEFDQRKNFLINYFNSIDGFEPFIPEGAFYLYVSCKGFISKRGINGQLIKNDFDFAEYLLMNAKVAVVPGLAFGMSPYFRISYATSLNDLKDACEQISASIKNLQ
tara:strand:- start:511 stop:882 length:372 start_codon:yes stop_codon:yes gene_type:complete